MSPLTNLSQACLDAYTAACNLMPTDLLPAFILIGGAATIAQGSLERKTEDVNIACSLEALVTFEALVSARRGGFYRCAADILWDVMDQGQEQFKVNIELLPMPGPFVTRVLSADKFPFGYVATIPELVRLRAVSVVDRGRPRDYKDFRLLVEMSTRRRLLLPVLDDEELEVLVEAAGLVEEEEGKEEVGGLLIRILSGHNLFEHDVFLNIKRL